MTSFAHTLVQITYPYSSSLEHQKARGIRSIAWGTLIGTALGSIAQFSGSAANPILMVGGYGMGATHLAYLLMFAVALIGLTAIRSMLNRGNLQQASVLYVVIVFTMMVLIYTPNLPNSVMVAGFSLPVVAAGVLLHKRGLFITIGLASAVIVAANLVYETQVALPFVYGVPETFDAIMLGVISVLVSGIMLNVFAGSQRVLLEQNLVLNQELMLAVTEAHEANARLRESEQQLEERVATRTEELRIALERAEEADRVKSQFLASMSHELRTPLNAILNFSQVMSMGIVGPLSDRQKEMLGEVVSSGKHLLSLINDVLDISKIQGGMLNLFVEENVNLHEIIGSAVTAAETMLRDKPVQLVQKVDSELPMVLCDRRRIQQILLNLLSNAAKFTEQGSVTLTAQREGDEIIFAVTDTGPGIAADEMSLVFQPFKQTAAGIKHAGGTGLGLPITRSLVEAHGGRLSMESEIGRGTTFRFTLPVESSVLLQQNQSQGASVYG